MCQTRIWRRWRFIPWICRKQIDRLGIELSGAFGGDEAVVHPLKQPDMVGLFQLLKSPGHSRLGHVQSSGGAGNVAGAVNFHKDADMAQGHRISRLSFWGGASSPEGDLDPGTVGSLILVKTVSAAHIAQTRSGLDEKIQIPHGRVFFGPRSGCRIIAIP